MKRRLKILALGILGQLIFTMPSVADNHRFIILASTTSTDNSGLFRHVLPKFTADSGIAVRVVAVGTGAAIRLAARGDADVVLVHARQQEERFIAQGHGIRRRAVMYNDFILVGPNRDPARIRSQANPVKALALIHRTQSIFASRGDKSGTHSKELALWREAALDPRGSSGRWYLETGSGMGATLNLAAAREAYTLSDRATWLSFKNKRGLILLLEGNKRLNNPYGVIVVNPVKHPGVKIKDATIFADWLTGSQGQAAIASFRLQGRQVFFPDAD